MGKTLTGRKGTTAEKAERLVRRWVGSKSFETMLAADLREYRAELGESLFSKFYGGNEDGRYEVEQRLVMLRQCTAALRKVVRQEEARFFAEKAAGPKGPRTLPVR
jgi:hypothetical protein